MFRIVLRIYSYYLHEQDSPVSFCNEDTFFFFFPFFLRSKMWVKFSLVLNMIAYVGVEV